MDIAGDQHVGGRTPGRVHHLFLRVLERVHLVKAAASDDAYQCLGHACGFLVDVRLLAGAGSGPVACLSILSEFCSRRYASGVKTLFQLGRLRAGLLTP